MNKKNKTILSIAVLAVLVGYLTLTGMGNSISTYVGINELTTGDYEDQLVNVNGTVVNDTLYWDPETMELEFKLTDGSGTVDVYYKGNLPNNIRDSIPVVVQGKYSGDELVARNILVKCPSKYEAEISE